MAINSKFSADLGLKTDADLQVDGNVTVSGNLTVNGTQTTVNSSTTSVEDSMLELANANVSSDTLDIGIYGNYDDGLGDGVSEYTGFFRDATDSTWKLFDGLEAEPTTTVNTSGTGYTLADLQVGDLTATTLTATNALTGSSITYPTSDGTNGQFLKTNGSGALSFGDIPAGYSDSDVESYLNSETKLGIGTSSPSENALVSFHSESSNPGFNLTTGQDSNTPMAQIGYNPGGGYFLRLGDASNNEDIMFRTYGATVLNGGQVQIGSATGSYTFAQKLIVGDGDSNDGITIQSGTTHQGNVAFNKGGGTTADGRILYQHDTNYMSFFTNNTERMRLNNAGDAHIGLNDNDMQLFLGSVGGAFGSNSSNNVRASGSNLMLNTPGQFIVEKEGSLGILMDTDKSFYVRPATSADNFGMYVRTSNSADTGMKIGRTGTNNAEMGIKVSSQGSNSFASFKFAISDATTWSSDDWFKLKVSGEMDGNFNDTSDQNLKENIVSIPNGDLAKVMQLNPVTFDWKNEVSRNDQTGFIAQEVETIFPNEVLGDAYDVEVEGSGKSINTIGLLSHTVKALQELKTLVDTLETRITTLESE
jgi:hypothetical protein